ncbi:MAG: hypothetical protein N2Z79_01885 [Candidatus Omnitrophica bacterium]|nr:hypothetical protein [Candidatus Omnitrophota bacterium]
MDPKEIQQKVIKILAENLNIENELRSKRIEFVNSNERVIFIHNNI